MRTIKAIGFAAVISVLLSATGSAHAQSGSWAGSNSGNWSTAALWTGSIIANGANNTATFSLPLTSPVSVTLDTARIIGNLTFDNTTASSSLSWTLRGSSTLTLNNTTQPTVSVSGTSGNADISATVTTPLSGTQGFMKTGAGNLLLSVNNPTLTGGINVNQGVLTISGGSGINPLNNNVVTLSGGTLRLGSGGGFNQRMVVPIGATFANSGITATMDGGTTLGGNTWYEQGQNTTFPTTGVPMGQTFASAANPSIMYTTQPATSRNVMMFDRAGGNTTGRFTLTAPTALSTIAFLTSSGNAGSTPPTITATLHYSDGTADASGLTFTSPDWFGGAPIAVNANGRINSTGYDSVNSGNPRLYDETITNPNATSPISSIDLSWTVGNNNSAHTAIFAINTPVLNGDPAQNFTNAVNVTADSTIDVRSVAGGTMGNVSIGTNTLNLTGATGASLALGNVSMSGNPTFAAGSGFSASVGAFTDGGTARTITLTGGGTYTAATSSPTLTAGTGVVIGGGTVNLNNVTAFGASPNVTANAGVLNLGTGVSATFASLSGVAGTVKLNGNTLTLSGGNGNFAGVIADGAGPGALVKSGAGTQILSGGGTFTGGVTVGGTGKLVLTNPNAVGANTINMTGGTLSVAGIPAGTLTGFNNVGTNWTVNGNSSIMGNVLTSTLDTAGQAGSVFYNQPVPTNAFTMNFTYHATAAGFPADGVVIMLQNDPRAQTALGAGGGSLGYATPNQIVNSVGLAINVYPNQTQGIAIVQGGTVTPPFTSALPVQVLNSQLAVTLTYDGTNLSGSLNDGTNTFNIPPTAIDIPTVVGGSQAFFGISGGTGGFSALQQISNLTTTFPVSAVSTYANSVNVADAANAAINVAATAGAPAVTMAGLTLGVGSSLTVNADTGAPADQAFFLTFGPTTLNGAASLAVNNNGAGFGTVTLGAVSGPGSLTKTGPGVLVLPSAGTYTGPTNINGGRLIVTNTSGSATGAGAINVNSGGTLGGTGIIAGNIQVNSGGTIEPGSPLFPAVAPGILNVANVTFAGGALRVKLNGNTPGTGHDQLLSTGTVSIGASVATLSASLGYAPSSGDQLVIVQAAAVSPGQFIGLPNNQMFSVGSFAGQQYFAQIHYTSNQIFVSGFTPVPEPVHMLLVGGVAGLAWRWRRRRAK